MGSYYVVNGDNVTISYLENNVFDPVTEAGIDSYNIIHDSIIIAHKKEKHFIINAKHPPKDSHSYKNKIPYVGRAYEAKLIELGIKKSQLRNPLPARTGWW